ncbi:hypothetical protein E2K93_14370 [Thalassotalea sp. HSM 43]|nr:hypothetical protein E2K93_14370 [Thalassotalea sp. HSM 43]
MTINTNSNTFQVSPPISQISVNKQNVIFTDLQSKKHIQLKNAVEAKCFLNWLLSVSDVSYYSSENN